MDAIKTLKVEKLSKWYPKPTSKKALQALKEVSFELTAGIYGLIGHNGAGKSTLLQILTGNLQADEGFIYVNDEVISTKRKDYKSLIGYMPQQQWIYEDMTCLQFMNYMATLKGIEKSVRKKEVEIRLEQVHLVDKQNKKIAELSGGMKQRLLFSQALLGNPSLLILDEPTAGVDPQERDNLKTLITTLCEGKIVILSTHILSDIESVADATITLDHGCLV